MRGYEATCVLTVLTVLLLGMPISGHGEVPQRISYQGFLTDDMGIPISDENIAMTVSLFAYPTDTTPLWEETYTSVPISNGIFNIEIGSANTTNPLPVSVFNGDLYLEISVYNPATEAWETMAPRQPFTSTAFAIKSSQADVAGNADTVDGMDAEALDQSAHLTRMDNPHEVTASQIGAVTDSVFSSHETDSAAHHEKTTHFSDLSDQATDFQIPDDITINYAALAGDADTVDSLHASAFVQLGTDYGRPGVSDDLYEGTTALGLKYLKKTGDSIDTGIDGWLFDFTNSSGAGYGLDSTAQSYALRGSATGDGGTGVRGNASGNSGKGVFGYASGENGIGVYGNSASGLAGKFDGPVEVAGEITTEKVHYSSPRTHYYSLGGEAFQPSQDYDYQNSGGSGGAFLKTPVNVGLVAPVNLPHGATVAEFKAFFYDDSDNDLVVHLAALNMVEGLYYPMASVDSTGLSDFASRATTDIENATVNNLEFALRVNVGAQDDWDDSKLRIMGIVITYTIKEAE